MGKLNRFETIRKFTISATKNEIAEFVIRFSFLVEDESPMPKNDKERAKKILRKLLHASLSIHERIVIASHIDDTHGFHKLSNFSLIDKEYINKLRENRKVNARGQNG